MKIKRVAEIIEANLYNCYQLLDNEVTSACGSDMMSDVLAYVKDQSILLTGLVNPQVIRTAIMMDIKCVAFVRGKVPTEQMIELATENSIVVMSSNLRLFVACGRLYQSGLSGGDVCK